MSNLTTDEESLKAAWQANRDAIGTIRKHLAKAGATIQVDIIIRDKAATQRHEKRMARKRK